MTTAFRVLYHEPICPECGSFDTTEQEVETGDGLTETALICSRCGTAWPIACVTDWDSPTHPITRTETATAVTTHAQTQ